MYQKEIAEAAERMDKLDPGWFNWIDPEVLDIGEPDRCLLGQRFGRYSLGMKALGLTCHDAVKMRLIAHSLILPLVTNCWQREVRRRLDEQFEGFETGLGEAVKVSREELTVV